MLRTDRFGDLTVDEDEVIELPDGLLGFVEMTAMVVLAVDDDGLFCWLQSVESPALAFLAVRPWPLFSDYTLHLAEHDQTLLEIADPGDVLVFCLLTSHHEPRRFTANLLGPVIVNQHTRRGRQVVLDADLPTQAELPAMG